MASLEWAALGINQLTGAIPPELGNLTTLTHMDFTLNQLSGEIPAELGNLTNLVWLGFWANQLSGDSARAGQSYQPGPAGLDHNRLERRDSARAGQPRQPANAGPQGKPLERRDSARVGQPHQSAHAAPRGERVDRVRPRGVGGGPSASAGTSERMSSPAASAGLANPAERRGRVWSAFCESEDAGRLRPPSGGGGFQTRPTTGLVRVGAPLAVCVGRFANFVHPRAARPGGRLESPHTAAGPCQMPRTARGLLAQGVSREATPVRGSGT